MVDLLTNAGAAVDVQDEVCLFKPCIELLTSIYFH